MATDDAPFEAVGGVSKRDGLWQLILLKMQFSQWLWLLSQYEYSLANFTVYIL